MLTETVAGEPMTTAHNADGAPRAAWDLTTR